MLEHVGAALEDLAGRRVEGDEDVGAGLVAGRLDAGEDRLQRRLVGLEVGGEAALVAAGGREALRGERLLQRVEDLGPDPQALREAGGAGRDDHELLEVDRVVGVGAAVQHVHHRHRQERSARRRRRARPGRGRAAGPSPPPPPWRPPARRRAARWRRAGPCSGCRRARSSSASRAPCSAARAPVRAAAISPLTLATALGHALAGPGARRRRAARPPRTRRSRRRRGPRRGRGRRTPARLRPRRSGCRASRGSGARGWRRWCSRVRQSIHSRGAAATAGLFAGWRDAFGQRGASSAAGRRLASTGTRALGQAFAFRFAGSSPMPGSAGWSVSTGAGHSVAGVFGFGFVAGGIGAARGGRRP